MNLNACSSLDRARPAISFHSIVASSITHRRKRLCRVFCCLSLTSTQDIQNRFLNHGPSQHHPSTAFGFHREPSSQNEEKETITKLFEMTWDHEHRTGPSQLIHLLRLQSTLLWHLGSFLFPGVPPNSSVWLLEPLWTWKRSLSSSIFKLLPFSCKHRWKLRWKPLKVAGSYSPPSLILAEGDEKFWQENVEFTGRYVIHFSCLVHGHRKFLPGV